MRPSARPRRPPADLLQEERANPFAIERALRVVTDAGVGEEVREVVPQTQLRVVAVGVLEALDRRDGFDALRQRLEPIDALLQRGQVGIGASALALSAVEAMPTPATHTAASVSTESDFFIRRLYMENERNQPRSARRSRNASNWFVSFAIFVAFVAVLVCS